MPLIVAAFMLASFLGLMELSLAARGFRPTAADSNERWLQQRRRVDEIGRSALILVGSSRVQLDIDLDVLRQKTGLEPIQLAIDGSSFLPILEDLAADPRVTGALLVGYQDSDINATQTQDRATDLNRLSQRDRERTQRIDFAATEAWLGDALHDHLRSYADAARPIASLRLRALDRTATPQYLTMQPDRSRKADYHLVAMPYFYYSRVMRNLGGARPFHEGMTWGELDEAIRKRVDDLKPEEKTVFAANTQHILDLVRVIEQRGGKVTFLNLPTSALIKEMQARRYPRVAYWDEFAKALGGRTFNVDDNPQFAAYECPDGSHLDASDRGPFTLALLGAGALLDIPRAAADK